MTDLEKKSLETLAEKEIEKLRLDISPSRTKEIAILYCDRNKFSLAEIQYLYDYVCEKNIFKNIVSLPSGSTLETMTLTEFSRWVELLTKKLEEFKNE